MGFGERLKELREKMGLTQEELGKKINQKKANISKYENGKLQPSLETIDFLAGFFNVSTDYLLGHTDNPSKVHELGALGADGYIKKHGHQTLLEMTSGYNTERENKRNIDFMFQAKTLADALLRLAELDIEYNFDDETMLTLVRKAKEKYGLPHAKGSEPAAHGPNIPGTGVFDKKGDKKGTTSNDEH